MPTRPAMRWVPGFGVILVGFFFLASGVASRLRGPVGIVELVEGVLIAALCFVVGAVLLARRAG